MYLRQLVPAFCSVGFYSSALCVGCGPDSRVLCERLWRQVLRLMTALLQHDGQRLRHSGVSTLIVKHWHIIAGRLLQTQLCIINLGSILVDKKNIDEVI